MHPSNHPLNGCTAFILLCDWTMSSYLGPFRIDESCFDGVVQRHAVLAQSEVGGRAVAVQDAVLGVGSQGLSVEAHGQGVVPLLAGLVTATHTLQELSFAEAGGAAAAGRPLRPLQRLGRRHHRRGRGGGRRRRVGGSAGGARTKQGELGGRERERDFDVFSNLILLFTNQIY